MNKIRLSLRMKLILAFSCVVLAAIAGIVIYANLDSSKQLQNYITGGGRYGLTALAAQLEDFYQANNSWDGVEATLETGHQGTGNGNARNYWDRIVLVNADLTTIWSSMASIPDGTRFQKSQMVNAVHLKNKNGKLVGYLYIEGESNSGTNDLSPFIKRINEVIVWTGLLAALAAIGLGIFISNTLLKPVNALTKAAAEIATGDLSSRVVVHGTDELAVLGNAFNSMATNLEAAEDRKKTLTADIAHELRTPISVQKAQIEAMMDGVIPVNQENFKTISEQTEFLSRMVEDLRLLALADSGELTLERQDVNMADFLLRSKDRLEPQVVKQEGHIVLDFQEGVENLSVRIDPDRVMQILQNLVTNALRYGRKGGDITIKFSRKETSILIEVIDQGQGIPPSALPHLFERFYRHERARDRESGGSGLGLAISKKLALAMNGDLTAGNDASGGAVFTLKLPVL